MSQDPLEDRYRELIQKERQNELVEELRINVRIFTIFSSLSGKSYSIHEIAVQETWERVIDKVIDKFSDYPPKSEKSIVKHLNRWVNKIRENLEKDLISAQTKQNKQEVSFTDFSLIEYPSVDSKIPKKWLLFEKYIWEDPEHKLRNILYSNRRTGRVHHELSCHRLSIMLILEEEYLIIRSGYLWSKLARNEFPEIERRAVQRFWEKKCMPILQEIYKRMLQEEND